jgi:hypothetical protein
MTEASALVIGTTTRRISVAVMKTASWILKTDTAVKKIDD